MSAKTDLALSAFARDKEVSAGWWATVTLFLLHGLIVSTWVSRIPAVQSALHINNGVLGLTLLSSAVGAVAGIPLTGWLLNRYSSRTVSAIATLLFCCALVLLGLSANVPSFALLLFLFGAAAAAMDVSMNAQGVEVEKALGKPTMSRFHGMFSLGGMLGATAGGAVAARGVSFLNHFFLSAVLCVPVALAAWPFLLRSDSHYSSVENRLPWRKIPPVLLALSAIGFCILLSEGAMADWTAVYLKQALGAGPGIAAMGYAVFSATMATFRFVGDLITARLGPLRTVGAGSLVAAAGMLWALAMPSPYWALPGFGLAGAGFSVIIPIVFGSGGKVEGIPPGPGIATVTGIGYIGFIVGPPAIGFTSQLLTLRYALGIVVLCCLVSAFLSRKMRGLQTGLVGKSPELKPFA